MDGTGTTCKNSIRPTGIENECSEMTNSNYIQLYYRFIMLSA